MGIFWPQMATIITLVTVVDKGSGQNWDGSYKEGGYVSAGCADGFADSHNKPKVKITCVCKSDSCSWSPAKSGWKCVE